MPIALDPTRTFRYVLRGDRKDPRDPKSEPKEDASWFELCSLTHGQSEKVNDVTEKDAFDGMTLALRFGLKGWGNFKDLDGVDVPFETDGKGQVTEACLGRLRLNDKGELAGVISGTVRLTAEEMGKSER